MRKLLKNIEYQTLCTTREEMRIFKEDIADHLLLGTPLLFCDTKKTKEELISEYEFFTKKYNEINAEICWRDDLAKLKKEK